MFQLICRRRRAELADDVVDIVARWGPRLRDGELLGMASPSDELPVIKKARLHEMLRSFGEALPMPQRRRFFLDAALAAPYDWREMGTLVSDYAVSMDQADLACAARVFLIHIERGRRDVDVLNYTAWQLFHNPEPGLRDRRRAEELAVRLAARARRRPSRVRRSRTSRRSPPGRRSERACTDGSPQGVHVVESSFRAEGSCANHRSSFRPPIPEGAGKPPISSVQSAGYHGIVGWPHCVLQIARRAERACGGTGGPLRKGGHAMSRHTRAALDLNVIAVLSAVLASGPARGATYELQADDHDGHGPHWVTRYAAGVNSWGIRGDGIPRQDEIWYNSFPWASGTYRVWLGAVTEPDGNSRCRLKIDGVQVKEIRYPYSTGSLDCNSSKLVVQDLDFGEHAINTGDEIRLWGESVYPCGEHGQYTRWYRLKFVSTGGSVDPTVITAPAAGTTLTMGQSYTLTGTGAGTLTWSYDAMSDGKGEITIGTGASRSFTVPTDITGAMTITIFLNGDGGKVQRTYDVVTSGGGNNPPAVNLTASPDAGTAPLAVHFDAGSNDPDGDALVHTWDWNYNGSTFVEDANTGPIETANVTYDAAGDYTAAVRVSDGTDEVIRTIAIRVSGSGSDTIVIECEDMTLTDYFVQDYYISVDYPNGKTTGTAAATFPGAAGRYQVEVVIVKENDGQPTLDVSIGGTLVDTIDYPLGSASRDPETVNLGEVDIASGAAVVLVGTMNDAGAAGRVDKIVFTPVSGGPAPSITVTSPNGGEIWYVGTTPSILWTATAVEDVQILYSTDGGSGWDMIAPTVDTASPQWGAYPWTVPNEPSTACRIVIQVYQGSAMDASDGDFEIRTVTDVDGDNMDDGWETTHFTDLSHDGTADGDGDTLTDYQEFMQGTDPTVFNQPPGGGGGGSDSPLACVRSRQAAPACTALFALVLFAALRCRRALR